MALCRADSLWTLSGRKPLRQVDGCALSHLRSIIMKTGSKAIALAFICAALAVTSLSQNQADSAQTPRTFALIVGVSRYPRLAGGEQLQFAERDAMLVADAIRKAGIRPENVRLLTGADATVSAIKAALGNWLARSAGENDTALFFFSGHGLYENEFAESYLLGYDSDAKDPFSTALSISEINQALMKRVRSRRVLILADAIRKDFFDPDSNSAAAASFIQSFNQIATSRAGASVIIANGPGEFSREGQRWGGQGVFTRHLVDAMSGVADRNGDGAITADELFDVVRAQVAEDTSNKQHAWRSETALAQITLMSVERKASAPIARVEPVVKANASQLPAEKPGAKAPTVSLNESHAPKPAIRVQEKPNAPEPNATANSQTQANRVEQPATKQVATNAPPETKHVETVAPPSRSRAPVVLPETQKINSASSPSEPSVIASTRTMDSSSPPLPPRPEVTPPKLDRVSGSAEKNKPAMITASVPVTKPEAAPSPLTLQLEAAIASKNLVEPKNASAWDFYQKLAAEPSASADLARLKPALADALVDSGRAIVSGDVCADNVSDRVDDFKRAGQMLARARSLKPEGADIAALEKLSAAQALLALQFYDEAERTLIQLQNAKLAAVENALGLAYQGKLDAWQAERAFKRASEIDANWATPHYNLALLYRSQQNESAIAELERAAALDKNSPNILVAIGDEYFSKQQWQSAADAFRKAVALRPADDTLRTKLGHALYSQGLQDEANREYQKARELRSKKP
jgi:tetratricopeptide (TPR) repeat protein